MSSAPAAAPASSLRSALKQRTPAPEEDTTKSDQTKRQQALPHPCENYEDHIYSTATKAAIQQYEAQTRSNKLMELVYFPKDNIYVSVVNPERPEGFKVLPDDAASPKLDLYIKEAFRYFSQPAYSVKHKYKQYKKAKFDDDDYKTEEFEVDMQVDDATSPPAALTPDVEFLKASSADVKEHMAARRGPSIFKLFDMCGTGEWDWGGGAEQSICKRVPYRKNFALSVTDPFCVDIKSFKLALTDACGEIEPIFCTVALYDLNARKKISETFNFDFNSDGILSEIKSNKSAHSATKLKRAVFHVSQRNVSIYLVMRVYKVLQGDEDDAAEPYVKVDKTKKGLGDMLRKQAKEFCARLGDYRQPLCWSAIRVFEDKEDALAIGKNTVLRDFYRTKGNFNDETFMEMLNTLFENEAMLKKQKMVPCECTFDVIELLEYNPVHKGHDIIMIEDEEGADKKLARDIREFPPTIQPVFYDYYVNDMYIYPEMISANSRGTLGSSSRNIAIVVTIKDNDDSLDTEGLKVIYGNSSEDLLKTTAFTSVSYHNKHPEFNDEFKIMLPTVLTPKHHILFTFYHISCNQKASKSKPVQTLLGHCILPLLPNNRILSGTHTVTVLGDLPNKKGYASSESVKSAKETKLSVKVSIRVESTIYPKDQYLSDFFRNFKIAINPKEHQPTSSTSSIGSGIAGFTPRSDVSGEAASPPATTTTPATAAQPGAGMGKGSLRNFNSSAMKRIWKDSKDPEMLLSGSIALLSDTHASLIITYLPRVFNQLLRIMCCPDAEIVQPKVAAFQMLCKLADTVTREMNESNERNSLLTRYVQEVFINFKDTKELPFFEVAKQWLVFTEECIMERPKGSRARAQTHFRNYSDTPDKKFPILYSWFLFDLIIKSMVLHLYDSNVLPPENTPAHGVEDRSFRYPSKFNEEFRKIIENLVQCLTEEIIYQSSVGLSLAKSLNANLALFLCDLLDVFDRGFVMKLIDGCYIQIIRKIQQGEATQAGFTGHENISVVQELKTTFLTVICDHEHFLPLSAPLPYSITSAEDLTEKLLNRHYMCGILLRDICHPTDIFNKERTVRTRALNLLRNTLAKHDYDSRYQDQIFRERIASAYFPLTLTIIDCYKQFEDVTNILLNNAIEEKHKADRLYSEVQSKLANREHLADSASNSPGAAGPGSPAEDVEKIKEELRKAKDTAEHLLTQVEEEKRRSMEERRKLLVCLMYLLKNANRDLLREWWKKEVDSKVVSFLALLNACVMVFQYPGEEELQNKYVNTGVESSVQNSMTAKEQLEQQYKDLTGRRKGTGSGGSLRAFKRGLGTGGAMAAVTSSSSGGSSGGTREFMVARRMGTWGKGSGSLGGRLSNKSMNEIEIGPYDIKKMVLFEQNLCSDVSLVISNILLDLFLDYKDAFIQQSDSIVMDSAFELLTSFLKTHQSETVVLSNLVMTRYFVSTFRPIIFGGSNTTTSGSGSTNIKPYSEILCKHVLRLCLFHSSKVRASSAATLYCLIKNNFQEVGNFSRVKIQMTVALSDLVDEMKDHEFLKSAFAVIAEFARRDKPVVYEGSGLEKKKFKNQYTLAEILYKRSRKTDLLSNARVDGAPKDFERTKHFAVTAPPQTKEASFSDQVKDLSGRLEATLKDNIRIKELQNINADLEVMTDLYFRIAMGYKHAPELSVTWFRNLAAYHRKNGRSIEAAECLLYIIAVVFEYLQLKDSALVQGTSLSTLTKVAPFLENEKFEELKVTFEDNRDPDFQSNIFTEDGFIAEIRTCIQDLQEAEYYEYAIEVEKFLCSLFDNRRDFVRLQEHTAHISQLYGHIVRVNNTPLRLLGTYYRVGFYGDRVDPELRGKEFIYKMPKVTRLADIKQYIETHIVPRDKDGTTHPDKIKIITSSATVDPKALEPGFVHVQITSVMPYFNMEEEAARVTAFERSTQLREFIFETPFIRDAKGGSDKGGHGKTVADQWKRKTIVTTEKPIPYMKTRLLIVSKKEKTLEPIEVSTETIDTINKRIVSIIATEPPNLNNLQMTLSGALIPMVNEGVPAIVKTFLDCPKPDDLSKPAHRALLKDKMRAFLALCEEGLRVDQRLLRPEHQGLHRELEKGFQTTQALFAPHLVDDSTSTTPTQSQAASSEDASKARKAVRFQ